jgi:guanylate kinase
MAGKVIIISAPSGCGKSTIINALMTGGDINMQFSVSATNRAPRGAEQNGVDYHFLSTEAFKQAIADDAFLEYEEVYPGRFYGTLKSELERIAAAGSNTVLDIDVNGGIRVKKLLADRALSIFIAPPSIDALRARLEGRGTDSAESIADRVSRAQYEIEQAPLYDAQVVNDDLAAAVEQTRALITRFLND